MQDAQRRMMFYENTRRLFRLPLPPDEVAAAELDRVTAP
jgi:hypothetical protein